MSLFDRGVLPFLRDMQLIFEYQSQERGVSVKRFGSSCCLHICIVVVTEFLVIPVLGRFGPETIRPVRKQALVLWEVCWEKTCHQRGLWVDSNDLDFWRQSPHHELKCGLGTLLTTMIAAIGGRNRLTILVWKVRDVLAYHMAR